MKYQDSVFTMLARRSVLPWQGLGPLTARLDALDLVAVHDQLVLHTSSQNHLARNERGLAFSPILTSCLNLPCTVSYLNGIYSLSLRFIVIVIVSLDVVGGAPMLAGLQQASTVQHVKGLRQTYNLAWLLHLVRKVLGAYSCCTGTDMSPRADADAPSWAPKGASVQK